MRVWLPGLLGLVLVGLVAGYALFGRRAPRPAAAADEAPPDVPAGSEARRSPERLAEARSEAAPIPSASAPSGPAPTFSLRMRPQVDAAAAVEARDQQIEAIRASGPDADGVLLHAVLGIGEGWQKLAKGAGLAVDFEPWECHRSGCFESIAHGSPESLEDLTSRILASDELNNWSGTKTRSAPIVRPDGTVTTTWMLLLTPDAGTGTPPTN